MDQVQGAWPVVPVSKWSQNGATLEGGAVFSLIIMFRKKMAPHSEVAPFSKTAPGVEVFCQICQKKVENGSTLVKVALFQYHPWHRFGSTHGTILAPLSKIELFLPKIKFCNRSTLVDGAVLAPCS